MNTSIIITADTDSRTIATLAGECAFGPWMEDNGYSLVSLDPDPAGNFGYVAVVAKDAPVLTEAAALKLEIAMELEELEEDTEDCDVPAFVRPVAYTEPSITTKTHTFNSKGNKMKAHQNLLQLIKNNPGISRTEVFVDASLRNKLISKAVSAKINAGDKLETKRYNRRLNRFIRQIRRDGVDIRIERKGRVAHYTIAEATQLELPFDLQAEARNSLITNNPYVEEELAPATPMVFTRADEDDNVNLSFEDLLSTLDDEAVAPVAK